jgi:hypothetical protein
MGKFLVADRLHFDGHEYSFGDPVTIEDEDLAEGLLGLGTIVGGDTRIRVATEPGSPPFAIAGITFGPRFRFIAAGEIDEAEALAIMKEPTLVVEVAINGDPFEGWMPFPDRNAAIDALQEHVDYDIEHGRPHELLGVAPVADDNTDPAPVPAPAPPAPAAPAPAAPATKPSQTVGQLVSMGKVKMIKIAEAEKIELPADATAKVMAEAIVAARTAKAA